jgi:octaprenyl-diphosphate synthase
VLQLSAARDLKTDEDIYLQIVRGKTAALFSAATEVGGVISGSDEERITALYDYGDALGIAFQIADDLLDYQGDAKATGKNVGDDFRERKLTLPVIKAVADATDEERAFWKRTIEKGDQREGDLEEAMAILNRHEALERTRDDAMAWANRAKEAMGKLPEHEVRRMLIELADYVVARLT